MKSNATRFALSIIFFFATCFSAQAQQAKKIPRIGAFLPASAAATAQLVEAFREGLQKQGYVPERNITLEHRYAEGHVERLTAISVELVRLNVDVMVVGSTPGAMAAKHSTGKIPIVIVTTGDPVASGLVTSLARPGGNITGVTALGQELAGKRLEVLKEVVPKVSRVAVLSNPENPDSELSLKGVEVAAQALGVHLRVQEVRDPIELEKAFEAIIREGARALMVLPDPMFVSQRERIVALAAKNRLPTMYAQSLSI